MADIRYKENGKDIVSIKSNLDTDKPKDNNFAKRNSDENNPFVLTEKEYEKKGFSSNSKKSKSKKAFTAECIIELIIDIVMACFNLK